MKIVIIGTDGLAYETASLLRKDNHVVVFSPWGDVSPKFHAEALIKNKYPKGPVGLVVESDIEAAVRGASYVIVTETMRSSDNENTMPSGIAIMMRLSGINPAAQVIFREEVKPGTMKYLSRVCKVDNLIYWPQLANPLCSDQSVFNPCRVVLGCENRKVGTVFGEKLKEYFTNDPHITVMGWEDAEYLKELEVAAV